MDVAERVPVWAPVVAWALCLVLALGVLVLAPTHLACEMPKLREAAAAGTPYRFFALSSDGSREALAALHIVFLCGLLAFAIAPSGRRMIGRMLGVSVLLGAWEIMLVVAAVFFTGGAGFAPPHMSIAALGLLLFLSGIGLGLETLLEKLASPKAPVVVVFGVGGLLGVVAFGVVGVASARNYARVDYTRAGRYVLSPATVALLERLATRVKVTTLFVPRGPAYETLRREVTDILDEYTRVCSRIEVSHLDPRLQLTATRELLNRLEGRAIQPEYNSVIFECYDTGRAMKVSAHEMLQMAAPEQRGDGGERGVAEAQPSFRIAAESVFHQALSVVSTTKPVRLYFVVGHGEKPRAVGERSPRMTEEEYEQELKFWDTDLLESELKRRYYRIRTLDLDELEGDAGIPEDCDVLVISGPWFPFTVGARRRQVKPFSRRHADIVRSYLQRGGRAFVMIDPVGEDNASKIRPLLNVLREYGVEVGIKEFVLDEVTEYVKGRFGTMVPHARPSDLIMPDLPKDYETVDRAGRKDRDLHPSVRALLGWPMAVPYCAEISTKPVEGLRHTRLLTTSARAWLHPVDGEFRGPIGPRRERALAVAVEKRVGGEPLLVVLGSSNMFIQPFYRHRNLADNGEFARQVLAWLAGSTEMLAVPTRATEAAYGRTDTETIRAVSFVSVVVIPSIFVLVGAVVWMGRRK